MHTHRNRTTSALRPLKAKNAVSPGKVNNAAIAERPVYLCIFQQYIA